MGLTTNPILHSGQILPGLAKVDESGEKLGTRLPGERHPTGAVLMLRLPPTTRGQRGRKVLKLSAGRDLILQYREMLFLPLPVLRCGKSSLRPRGYPNLSVKEGTFTTFL